jgi:aquaporin Z
MGKDSKPLLAELFGTFVLVFIGAGACASGAAGLMGAAVAHGVALMVIVYMVGGVSGAHVNPAVTFGLAVAGKTPWPRAVRYWGAQIAGAILAALALRALVPDTAGCLTTLAPGVSAGSGVLVEAILTAFLVFAVMVSGVLGKNGNVAGLAIGLVLTMDILMGGGLTGASMNPACTLGPAIVQGEFADVWVYIVGPCAGGAGGAALASYLHS